MPNYIKLIGDHYPDAQAYVPEEGDPTVYTDVVWTSTPVPKETLDQLTEKEILFIGEEQDTFANRPAYGKKGRLFLATDTLEYYRDTGTGWQLVEAPLTGDVTRSAGSSTLTLNTVNSNVGTYGSSSQVPVITVNAKGLVTGVSTQTVTSPPPGAGGSTKQVQFNSSGALAGDAKFAWYNGSNEKYLALGGTPNSFPDLNMIITESKNTYSQIIAQNTSSGPQASMDFCLTADTGTDSARYFDIGINGSGYNDNYYSIMPALAGYILMNGGQLVIGTETANDIIFHTGGPGTANEVARFDDGVGLVMKKELVVVNNTTANRPGSPQNGMIRYNTTTSKFEGYEGGSWVNLTSGATFGANFQQASNDTESSTTSTSYVQKLTMTTQSLASGGVYRIGWSTEAKQSSTSAIQQIRVQIDNTTNIGDYHLSPRNASNYVAVNGFYYYTGTGSAITIDVDYLTTSGSYTAYMRKTRLEIWRVS